MSWSVVFLDGIPARQSAFVKLQTLVIFLLPFWVSLTRKLHVYTYQSSRALLQCFKLKESSLGMLEPLPKKISLDLNTAGLIVALLCALEDCLTILSSKHNRKTRYLGSRLRTILPNIIEGYVRTYVHTLYHSWFQLATMASQDCWIEVSLPWGMAELRSVSTTSTAVCAMIAGTYWMQLWCAHNLASLVCTLIRCTAEDVFAPFSMT